MIPPFGSVAYSPNCSCCITCQKSCFAAAGRLTSFPHQTFSGGKPAEWFPKPGQVHAAVSGDPRSVWVGFSFCFNFILLLSPGASPSLPLLCIATVLLTQSSGCQEEQARSCSSLLYFPLLAAAVLVPAGISEGIGQAAQSASHGLLLRGDGARRGRVIPSSVSLSTFFPSHLFDISY